MWFISILLFLASSAYAQSSNIASSYRVFDGGLNTCDSSIALPVNESPDLLNVVIDEPLGTLSQRGGYQVCGYLPSGNTATNIYEYIKNDGSRNLIVTDNQTIWQTGDCQSYTTIATGLLATSLPRFATIQDKLWIVNGSTYTIVWDGTSKTMLDGKNGLPLAPIGKLITYWKSRVWIGNSVAAPSGLYFSSLVDTFGNILDPATSTNAWSNSLNLIYFDRDDGSPLYGIKIYRDNLYAFKATGILRLLFESEFTANGVTVPKTAIKTGSKFNESIVEMDDGLLRFVGRDGVYLFDGSTVKRISKKWTPTFYSFKQPSHAEAYKLWDTSNDWLTGNLTTLSTSYSLGSIALDIRTKLIYDFSNSLGTSTWTTTGNWAINAGKAQYNSGSSHIAYNGIGPYIFSDNYMTRFYSDFTGNGCVTFYPCPSLASGNSNCPNSIQFCQLSNGLATLTGTGGVTCQINSISPSINEKGFDTLIAVQSLSHIINLCI